MFGQSRDTCGSMVRMNTHIQQMSAHKYFNANSTISCLISMRSHDTNYGTCFMLFVVLATSPSYNIYRKAAISVPLSHSGKVNVGSVCNGGVQIGVKVDEKQYFLQGCCQWNEICVCCFFFVALFVANMWQNIITQLSVKPIRLLRC